MTLLRYTPWEIRDFTGGQVEKLNNNVIPDNAAYYCRNFLATRMGSISKRKGQGRLNTTLGSNPIHGLFPYYFDSGEHGLIAMYQGELYNWNGTNLVLIDTNYPDALLADILSGDVYPDINAILFNEVEFNQADEYDFPINTEEMVMFERTVHYVVGMNGINRPFRWDGSTIGALKGAPSRARYPVLHKERIFCVDTSEPSTLRWSEVFQPEEWPPINYWDIERDDGSEITNLTKIYDDLLIFKNRSMHVLKGSMMEDFTLREITNLVGCAGPMASTVYQGNVYFISEKGLYVSNGATVQNISDIIIPDTWKLVNIDYLHRATVTVVGDRIWFTLPYDGSEINNLTLVYDISMQAIFPMEGIKASCYAHYNEGTTEGDRLFSGDTEDGFINIQNEGTEDFGSSVNAYWRGKFFDMGRAEIEKKTRDIYIQDSPDTAEIADLSVCLDYGKDTGGNYVYNNLAHYKDKGLSRQFKFNINSNRWNYLSPLIEHSKAGACEIRGIAIPFKPKRDMAVRE